MWSKGRFFLPSFFGAVWQSAISSPIFDQEQPPCCVLDQFQTGRQRFNLSSSHNPAFPLPSSPIVNNFSKLSQPLRSAIPSLPFQIYIYFLTQMPRVYLNFFPPNIPFPSDRCHAVASSFPLQQFNILTSVSTRSPYPPPPIPLLASSTGPFHICCWTPGPLFWANSTPHGRLLLGSAQSFWTFYFLSFHLNPMTEQ